MRELLLSALVVFVITFGFGGAVAIMILPAHLATSLNNQYVLFYWLLLPLWLAGVGNLMVYLASVDF